MVTYERDPQGRIVEVQPDGQCLLMMLIPDGTQMEVDGVKRTWPAVARVHPTANMDGMVPMTPADLARDIRQRNAIAAARGRPLVEVPAWAAFHGGMERGSA